MIHRDSEQKGLDLLHTMAVLAAERQAKFYEGLKGWLLPGLEDNDSLRAAALGLLEQRQQRNKHPSVNIGSASLRFFGLKPPELFDPAQFVVEDQAGGFEVDDMGMREAHVMSLELSSQAVLKRPAGTGFPFILTDVVDDGELMVSMALEVSPKINDIRNMVGERTLRLQRVFAPLNPSGRRAGYRRSWFTRDTAMEAKDS